MGDDFQKNVAYVAQMGNSHDEIRVKLYVIRKLKKMIEEVENGMPEGVCE